jgi:hypothetical protein
MNDECAGIRCEEALVNLPNLDLDLLTALASPSRATTM